MDSKLNCVFVQQEQNNLEVPPSPSAISIWIGRIIIIIILILIIIFGPDIGKISQ